MCSCNKELIDKIKDITAVMDVTVAVKLTEVVHNGTSVSQLDQYVALESNWTTMAYERQ